MSEESTTTTTTEGDDAARAAAAEEAPTADTGAVTESAADAGPPAKVHWWNRSTGGQTYGDRYIFPALVPLVSVAVIIFYVINVSRVFLSGKGTIAIVTASAITIAILVFAAAISSAVKMRSQSLAIFIAVCGLAVMLAGYITVGHAQEKTAAAVVACKPITTTIKVDASASLKFNGTTFTAKAGCVSIVYGGSPGHTLAFDPPGPSGPTLNSDGTGGPGTFAWTFTPGNYVFYCTVPGHRQAGMQATLVVK
jgi:uncharacterized cupredoxin-like copper-binding protein